VFLDESVHVRKPVHTVINLDRQQNLSFKAPIEATKCLSLQAIFETLIIRLVSVSQTERSCVVTAEGRSEREREGSVDMFLIIKRCWDGDRLSSGRKLY